MHPHPLTSLDSDHSVLADPAYNPDRVFDTVMARLQLKNDAALARALEVAPPVISKIRHRRLPIGATVLLRLHEVSTIPVAELRQLMGAPAVPLPHQLRPAVVAPANPMAAIVADLAHHPV